LSGLAVDRRLATPLRTAAAKLALLTNSVLQSGKPELLTYLFHMLEEVDAAVAAKKAAEITKEEAKTSLAQLRESMLAGKLARTPAIQLEMPAVEEGAKVQHLRRQLEGRLTVSESLQLTRTVEQLTRERDEALKAKKEAGQMPQQLAVLRKENSDLRLALTEANKKNTRLKGYIDFILMTYIPKDDAQRSIKAARIEAEEKAAAAQPKPASQPAGEKTTALSLEDIRRIEAEEQAAVATQVPQLSMHDQNQIARIGYNVGQFFSTPAPQQLRAMSQHQLQFSPDFWPIWVERAVRHLSTSSPNLNQPKPEDVQLIRYLGHQDIAPILQRIFHEAEQGLQNYIRNLIQHAAKQPAQAPSQPQADNERKGVLGWLGIGKK